MDIRIFRYIFKLSGRLAIKEIADVQEIDHGIKILTPSRSCLDTYFEILRRIPESDYILCPLSLTDGDMAAISLGIRGKMKYHENFLDTAARELKEEVGLNINSYGSSTIKTFKRDKVSQNIVFYTANVKDVYNTPIDEINISPFGDIKSNKICVLIHGEPQKFIDILTSTPRYLINDGENIVGFCLISKNLFTRFIAKFEDLFNRYYMSNFYCIVYDKKSNEIYDQPNMMLEHSTDNCIYTLKPDGNIEIKTDVKYLDYWNDIRPRRQECIRNRPQPV